MQRGEDIAKIILLPHVGRNTFNRLQVTLCVFVNMSLKCEPGHSQIKWELKSIGGGIASFGPTQELNVQMYT